MLEWEGRPFGSPAVAMAVDRYWLELFAPGGERLLCAEMLAHELNWLHDPGDSVFPYTEFPAAVDSDTPVACVHVRTDDGVRALRLELLEPGSTAAARLERWIDENG